MIRGPWMVENGLHWVLDMIFRDDECRVRTDNAPFNLAIIKHSALNVSNPQKRGFAAHAPQSRRMGQKRPRRLHRRIKRSVNSLIEKPNSLDGTVKRSAAGRDSQRGYFSQRPWGFHRDCRDRNMAAPEGVGVSPLDRGWGWEGCRRLCTGRRDAGRDSHGLPGEGGIEGLKSFGHEGSSRHLTDEQAIALGDWVDAPLPSQHPEDRGLAEALIWAEL